MKRPLLFAALSLVTSGCPAAENSGAFVPQSFTGEVTLKLGYSYLLTLPDGYDGAPEKKWPLLAAGIGGALLYYYRRKLLPRKRELEVLLGAYE